MDLWLYAYEIQANIEKIDSVMIGSTVIWSESQIIFITVETALLRPVEVVR